MGTGAPSVYAVEWKCRTFYGNMLFKTLEGIIGNLEFHLVRVCVHNLDDHQILPQLVIVGGVIKAYKNELIEIQSR